MSNSLPWHDAREACIAMGAHLMEIRTQEELDIAIAYSGVVPLWIGGSEIQEEGNWVWDSNQEEVNPNEFWYDYAPPYDSERSCLAVSYDGFVDSRCSCLAKFICEFN